MKILIVAIFICLSIVGVSQNTTSTEITPNGQKLVKLLDSSHLDRLWQKGYTVNWLTGVSISKTSSSLTHCSAYGAAIAYRLGVYLLRPPQHGQTLLANAQCVWLATDSAKNLGWQKVSTALEAQNAADSGFLVVIGYQNPNPKSPGHFAIVRPAVKTLTLLNAEGPQESQSGNINSENISMKVGFSSHPLAFPNGVIYYRHNVNWDNLTLPVQFFNIQLEAVGNDIKISWQTASELNTRSFTIQRSVDGISFSDVGNQDAIGDGANSYSFMDEFGVSNLQNILFYRLKSVDIEGSICFSKVVSILPKNSDYHWVIAPNPAKDFTTIRFNSAINKAMIMVYDFNGKEVLTQNINRETNLVILNTEKLANGVYVLKVNTYLGCRNQKLVIRR